MNSFLKPNNNYSDGKHKMLIFEQGMQSKLPKMILKVRHCCLLRFPRYCAKSLLTLKAFSLIVVLHPGASKNSAISPQDFFLYVVISKLATQLHGQPPYHASLQNMPSGAFT